MRAEVVDTGSAELFDVREVLDVDDVVAASRVELEYWLPSAGN